MIKVIVILITPIIINIIFDKSKTLNKVYFLDSFRNP